MQDESFPLYTIGYSTHPFDEFIGLLRVHGIEILIDVRTVPRSRHNPQFQQSALRIVLEKNHLGYDYRKIWDG